VSPAAAGLPSPATDFSFALLDAFIGVGVRHVVLTPGARSQALALAAASLANEGLLTLEVRLDERAAAFTALGLSIESGVPTLIITTSGSAVGNLLPAVMEAAHSGVPLIVLSADRPVELRGTGSNQTTSQPGIFSHFTRLERDVPAPALLGLAAHAELAGQLAAESLDASLGLGRPERAAPGAAFTSATTSTSGQSPVSAVAHSGATLPESSAERMRGPVHLNLQFREPLSGPAPERVAAATTIASEPVSAAAGPNVGAPGSASREESGGTSRDEPGQGAGFGSGSAASALPFVLEAGPRTVVVAGHGAGPRAEEVARLGGWPLIAEVSSGAHFGPNLIVAYRPLLAEEFGTAIERVILFGHPTLSREVPSLAIRAGVETIVVECGGEPVNPGGRAARIVRAVDVSADAQAARDTREGRAYLGRWVAASRAALDTLTDDAPAPDLATARSSEPADRRDFARSELAVLRAPISRAALTLAVWRATWPHDRLVLGASRLIRELDSIAPGKKIAVAANRGLAGIDGTVSTAIGIALASQDPRHESGGAAGITRALIGDLTLLHDAGGLHIGVGESRPRIQLIVGNDGGGTIFDSLEVKASADPDAFTRVMSTPQSVDLEQLAGAYGWTYTRVSTRGDLDRILTTPPPGQSLVDVTLA
jgi:2-succinyl-5-enolpyruvyl-6-hydroxy-3-cyclohexene-1-carboxylate synthase